jgi:ABC-type branched-subunit amino acid transport system ATPase component/ABC-type branched-subunit amino acid transport system permease subunit
MERARMAGISAARMSTLVWALAGAVAAYTTVLILPTRGFIATETLGPVLLLRALAPAVIARLESLPIALGAGILVGVVDQVLVFNYPTSGMSEVALLGIILAALLFQTRRGTRVEERTDWAGLQPWTAIPEAFCRVWGIRNLGRVVAVVTVATAVLIGLTVSNATAVTFIAIGTFSLIGLSIGIVTGLGGQLSLGQFALAGIGATVSYAVTSRLGTGSFPLALVYAALAGAAVSIVLGLPALRVRGMQLGVVTLGFALAAQRWVLSERWALGEGIFPERPEIGPVSLQSTSRYYFWALGVVIIGFLFAHNTWRGGIGLRLRGVRDNEDAARSFGVSATAVKLQGFGLAGVLAGMAGAVYGHLLSQVRADSFDVVTSINVVALTVLGGIGLLAGPLLGALYIIGIPRFFPLDNAGLAASAIGWLLLILYFPGGIAQLIGYPRRKLIHWLARRHGIDPTTVEAGEDIDEHAPTFTAHGARLGDRRTPIVATRDVVLRADGLAKNYGGISAVDGVSLTLREDEILGLMGSNGAGKTTLFELLGGFTSPDAGRIHLAGNDITVALPEERARRGLIRSFQDAALFPTLTVGETVSLAFERTHPTNVLLSAAGIQRSERAKRAAASEILSLMGLDRFRGRQIRELSTGTRRITELACIVALEPLVLLLDEPSGGIAQRETEALGELLLRLRSHLGCAMIIIEHDMPLLMGLASRMMAMESGRVIATGSPEQVRNDPLVVASYLGTNVVAIERSGQQPLPASPVMTGSS